MDYDINKLKLKTVSQLDDKEKDFIKSNTDKLNDEDKAAYSSFLNPDIPAPETQEGESAGGEGNGENSESEAPAEGSNEGEGEAPSPEGGGGAGSEAPPAFSFKSEEEAREWVRKVKAEDETKKQEAIDAAQTPEEKKYVEDNWKPKDWNEGLRTAVKIAKEEIKAEQESERVQKNFDKLDKEWKTLSKERSIPSLDTVEGRRIHNQIIGIMRGYGLATFKSGYEKWAKIEGVDITNGTEPGEQSTEKIPDPAKEKIDAQKKAAAKIGGQNAGAGTIKGSASIKTPNAADIRTKSTNKLIREGLAGLNG